MGIMITQHDSNDPEDLENCTKDYLGIGFPYGYISSFVVILSYKFYCNDQYTAILNLFMTPSRYIEPYYHLRIACCYK
jgi:hypothetical protein